MDYNSYTFKNKVVDRLEDPKPKKRKKPKKTIKQRIETVKKNRAIDKADKAKRQAEIDRQYNEKKKWIKTK